MPARGLRSLSLVVLALAVSFALHAQEPQGGGPPAQMGPPPGGPPTAVQELGRLDQALTLTEAQKTAILPILEKRHGDMEALRHGSADRDASRQQMRTLMEASNQQIRALLTEPQRELFDGMRGPRRPRPGGASHEENGPPPPPPDGSGPPPTP